MFLYDSIQFYIKCFPLGLLYWHFWEDHISVFCVVFLAFYLVFNLFRRAPRGQREHYMLSPGHTCGACNHNCSLFHCVTTPWYGFSASSPANERLFELFKPSRVSASRSFIAYYSLWPFGIFFFKRLTHSWIFFKKINTASLVFGIDRCHYATKCYNMSTFPLSASLSSLRVPCVYLKPTQAPTMSAVAITEAWRNHCQGECWVTKANYCMFKLYYIIVQKHCWGSTTNIWVEPNCELYRVWMPFQTRAAAQV